jgi:hypothetical protein
MSILNNSDQKTKKLLSAFDDLLEKGKKEIHWSLVNNIKGMLDDAEITYNTGNCWNSEYTLIEIIDIP